MKCVYASSLYQYDCHAFHVPTKPFKSLINDSTYLTHSEATVHHRRIRHDHTDRPHTATATTTITASPATDATAAFLSGM